MMNIYLYGPSGSGKSTLGPALAQALDLPFYDLDDLIAAFAGMTITQIFAQEGEAGFRQRELAVLNDLAGKQPAVVALGGGALLNPEARAAAEQSGQVLYLSAPQEILLTRVMAESASRPLLAGDPAERLTKMLNSRSEHYRSFRLRLDTSSTNLAKLTAQAQLLLGAFRVRGMGGGYDVRITEGGIDRVGDWLAVQGLKGPAVLVADQHVAALYLERVLGSLSAAGYAASSIVISPGEENKTLQTVQAVWEGFIRTGIERSSTVVALGGGVVGDLTGFAAATFLRGVNWVNLPTTLLSMVDSSLGGKTGIDLPQAKNLVGAFYPPSLVLADPTVLQTLPERELRGGLAEVVKHGIISDPDLFALCAGGLDGIRANLYRVVSQGMAVKLQVIEADPYEKNLRQALNLGHTIGHGVELASNFRLSHGEAVAIGTVAESRLAERLGIAHPGLAEEIRDVLARLGLPVEIPGDLPAESITQAMLLDKKRAAGKIRFALPVRIGSVQTGVEIDQWQTMIFNDVMGKEGVR